MEALATREEQIEEAIKRLGMLKELHESVLRDFKKNQRLYYSERSDMNAFSQVFTIGTLYWIDNHAELAQIVDGFEKKYNCVVYHATLEHTEFGTCFDLFHVSPYKEEWEMDREELSEGLTCAYVSNLDCPHFSEFGSIRFIQQGGGLLRTA